MKKIFVFGNGNISWEDFDEFYINPIKDLDIFQCEFIICEFTGVDTLMMEFLKNKSEKVTILHIGERPRYFASKFRTYSRNWKIIGGFNSDSERDNHAISLCTHFLAKDFNSDDKVKSGTFKNIEKCFALNKMRI